MHFHSWRRRNTISSCNIMITWVLKLQKHNRCQLPCTSGSCEKAEISRQEISSLSRLVLILYLRTHTYKYFSFMNTLFCNAYKKWRHKMFKPGLQIVEAKISVSLSKCKTFNGRNCEAFNICPVESVSILVAHVVRTRWCCCCFCQYRRAVNFYFN